MLTWCRRENNVAVIPVISALAGASRAHRNIWSTGTLEAKCCAQHLAEVMADRLREHFGGALPAQCIVNEYRPGQGIGMHADHQDFGPVVASLSLADDWPMRFRPRSVRPYARDGQPGDEVAVLPRRSVLVLAGAARSAWMHGIDRSDSARAAATRLSATFRSLAR